MSISMILLNVGYVIFVLSPLCKKVTTLRLVLLMSTIIFVCWSALEQMWMNVAWNVMFGGLHLWKLVSFYRDRFSIKENTELESIRTRLFPNLEKVDFHKLWSVGVPKTFVNAPLISAGLPVERVFVLMEGEVDIITGDQRIRRGPNQLLGEMELVTGKPALATVQAVGTVEVRSFNVAQLQSLVAKHPQIESGALLTISQQVATKLVSGNQSIDRGPTPYWSNKQFSLAN